MSFAVHSPGHVDCPACRQQSLLRAEVQLRDLTFRQAFERWLAARVVNEADQHQVRYLKDESVRTYRECAWALEIFFGALRLSEIHDGHLRTFQADRATCTNPPEPKHGLWKRPAGQNRIRKEVALLLRVMRSAGCWTDELDEAFDQLPLAMTDVQRVLEPAEQRHWLTTLRSRPEWFWLHDYSVVALQTCSSTKELRSIRLRDINYRSRTLRIGIEGSKNKFRNRTIPLPSEEVIAALRDLSRRARDMGSSEPEHYLFPFGASSRNGVLDVTRPMTKCALKTQWSTARRLAGLTWLRPYDLRHTAITRMAEAGTPIPTIMSFAGHISVKMQQHYTTISMQAKRRAAAQVWVDPRPGQPQLVTMPPRKPVQRVPELGPLRRFIVG